MPENSEIVDETSAQPVLIGSPPGNNLEVCQGLNSSSSSSGYGDSSVSSSSDKISHFDEPNFYQKGHDAEITLHSGLGWINLTNSNESDEVFLDRVSNQGGERLSTEIRSDYGKFNDMKTSADLCQSPNSDKNSSFLTNAMKNLNLETKTSEENLKSESDIPGQKCTENLTGSNSTSLNSSGMSEPGKRGVTTSTPVNNNEQVQVVSFRDSVILSDSSRQDTAEQIPQQQQTTGTYDWYGLPAPMFGTMIPNRIFVGGISPQTTETELFDVFTHFGTVRATKIISDRAGVSKGYGFVTFETEQEAKAVCDGMAQKAFEPIILRERRLNIAPAVKKQQTRSESNYPPAPPSPPPYIGASFYMSQGNPSQYYYQAVPLQVNENYFSQDLANYGSQVPQTYYTPPQGTPGAPTPTNSLYCLPEQYQQPYLTQSQSVPYQIPFIPATYVTAQQLPPPPQYTSQYSQYPLNTPTFFPSPAQGEQPQIIMQTIGSGIGYYQTPPADASQYYNACVY